MSLGVLIHTHIYYLFGIRPLTDNFVDELTHQEHGDSNNHLYCFVGVSMLPWVLGMLSDSLKFKRTVLDLFIRQRFN